MSNFDYSLAPFHQSWGDGIAQLSTCLEADLDTRVIFLRRTLQRMVQLSYTDRVKRGLPAPFMPYLPPPPTGTLDWPNPAAKSEASGRGSAAAISADLLNLLRCKLPPGEVTAWLDSALADHALRIPIVVQTLIHAGAKSLSHLEKLLDKFAWLFAYVAPDARTKVEVVSAAVRYWSNNQHMSLLLVRKLLKYGVVDAAAVISHSFSPSARTELRAPYGWDAVTTVADIVVKAQKTATMQLRRAEKERDRIAGGENHMLESVEERVAECYKILDATRREKKALFANVFAGACAALSMHAGLATAAGKPVQDQWWHSCIGHTRAFGRRYQVGAVPHRPPLPFQCRWPSATVPSPSSLPRTRDLPHLPVTNAGLFLAARDRRRDT